ncbi:MAG: hypothetical protein CM15mP127_04650 [Gammaproteobacteria bacterium]|nr:MAG: hypothetical protein CM15mP127_04650 [Gammaproteobacteria bacterium]
MTDRSLDFLYQRNLQENIINLDINEFNYLEIGSEIFINASLNLMFGLRRIVWKPKDRKFFRFRI